MATDAPGTDPTGTDPTGTDPTGTDPTGTDPTGTDAGDTDVSGSTEIGCGAVASADDADAAEDRPVRLTLLTRAQCHLCDVAKQALARVAARAGERWREVDVDSDPELQAEFWDRVPVVLLDGAEHGYWRVDEERLLRDLQQASAQ